MSRSCSFGWEEAADGGAAPLAQIYVCRSGSAADTQAIASYLQYYLAQHQMELDDEIQVKTAAAFATKLVYSNKVRQRHSHLTVI